MKVSYDVQAVIIKQEGTGFLFLTIRRLNKDTQEDERKLVLISKVASL